MSLRSIFLILGLTSFALCAGVVYIRVIDRPETRGPSFVELRTASRICHNECGLKAEDHAKESKDAEELKAKAKHCVETCRTRVLKSRGIVYEPSTG